MTGNKKLAITMVVILSTILIGLCTIIVVLVAGTQSADANVKVKYEATDVSVTLKATAYAGDDSYTFREGGASAGNDYISLNPQTPTGELSFVESEGEEGYINLDRDNKTIVFEYEFQNDVDTVDVKIESAGVPSINQDDNLAISYAYSDTKLDYPFSLQDEAETTYSPQLLPAYVNETTKKYIYVYATVTDIVKDAELNGSFGWNMSRPVEGEVATYTLNTAGAELVERTSTGYSTMTVPEAMEYKIWATTTGEIDIDVYPADLGANNLGTAFVGWSTTPNATEAEAISAPAFHYADGVVSNAIEATSKTLYPVFKESTVPDSSITWVSSTSSYRISSTKISTTVTEFVFPDIYQKGSNPIAKVTAMVDGLSASYGILNSNTTVTKVWLGRFLTNVGGYSFYKATALTNVTIPNSVTSIGNYAFNGCSGLTSVTIPNSVTSIGSHVFNGCSGLASITIPNGVTSIGGYAFYGCSGLTCSITIPDSVTSIGGSAFRNCSGLTSVTIGSGVTSIGSEAFNGCSGLASITIPKGVTSIESSAFYNCSKLASITIPNSVTSIGSSAFYNCSGLTRVDYSGTVKQWCNISFANSTSNPNYFAKNLYIQGNLLTTITESNLAERTSIGTATFAGCDDLTSITIPNSVTSIGNYAFNGCRGLTSVTIPNSVTSIGSATFYNCSSLTSVIFDGATASTTWSAGGTSVSVLDPSTNATNLKTTYYNKTWTRTAE